MQQHEVLPVGEQGGLLFSVARADMTVAAWCPVHVWECFIMQLFCTQCKKASYRDIVTVFAANFSSEVGSASNVQSALGFR